MGSRHQMSLVSLQVKRKCRGSQGTATKMLGHLVMTCLLLVCAEGHIGKNLGGIYRYRRDEEIGGVIYAPCKDTYSQCIEWKKSGMCEMPQYKDYMPLVCTDTCGFCKRVQKARSEITAPRIIDATEDGVGDNNFEGVKVIHKANIHSKLKASSKPAKKEEVSKSDEGSGAPVEVDSKFFEGKPDHEEEQEKVESADKKTTIKIEDLDKSKPEEVKPEQTPNGDSVKKAKLKEEIAEKLLSAKTKVNKIRKQKEKKETAVKKEKVDKSQKNKEIAVKTQNIDDTQKSIKKAPAKENVDKVPKERGNVRKKENVKVVPKKEKEDASKKGNISAAPKKIDITTKNIYITTKNGTLVKKEKLTVKKKSRLILDEESSMTPVKKSNKEQPKPTIGMKSKISINFRKKDAISHEKAPQEITLYTLEKAAARKTVIESPKKQMIVRESISHEKISTKTKIEGKKESNVAKKESKQVKNDEVNEFMSMKGDTAAKRSKQISKKSHTAKREKQHLEAKKESPVTKVAEKSKEPVKPKKRTSDSRKVSNIVATIADLSGAGSGEIDTDILSGDSRSAVESGDDDDDDEESESEEPQRQRQNVQLHGDPEMVDLLPKEIADQPNLNDFPDKDAATIKKGSEKEGKKKNVTEEEAELDDIKIEELLNPKPEPPRRKQKTKAIKEKSVAYREGKISLVLQQNFNSQYEKLDTPRYKMLAGNIKKDIEKMITGTDVNDITFSEVTVEGNPRQSGKTKANFNIKAPSSDWMKELLKLVDGGDIDGLRVIKGSLEIEEQ